MKVYQLYNLIHVGFNQFNEKNTKNIIIGEMTI